MRHYQSVKSWGLILAVILFTILATHLLLESSLKGVFENLILLSEQWLLVSALVIAGLSVDVILPIPSSVLSVWSVISLGFSAGFVAIWLGMCISCLLGYGIGKSTHARLQKSFFRKSDIEAAQDFSSRYGLMAILLMRAVPVLAEASTLAAGIVKMPFKKFLLATALSNAGIAMAYAMVGSYAIAHSSFALAFIASISFPLLALACYRGYLVLIGDLSQGKDKKTLATESLGTQQLQPSFSLNFSYPLCFTDQVFDVKNTCLLKQVNPAGELDGVRTLFFVDEGVSSHQDKLGEKIIRYCEKHKLNYCGDILTVPGGESAKTQEQINRMHEQMLSAELDRQSYVIAIGGGAVLDAVGYAAATFHRGIRLVRMPTTVLAQNDAGVGVKNGINAKGIKNLFGSFAVPHAIINDRVFLHSLSARDYRSGFAEAIKVALIRDAEFFHWIVANVEELNRREDEAAGYLIKRCAELHLNQICHGGDPFELGSARPLDYGHWAAHKLESLTKHELSHGEAVAIGMALDTLYAVEAGLLKSDMATVIIQLIKALGFSIWHPALHWDQENGENAVLAGLEEFRQHLGGDLCITLLSDIGKTVDVNKMNQQDLLRARDRLQHL